MNHLDKNHTKIITLAFTGASGMPYGLRLLEQLLSAGCTVWLLYSQAAQIVIKQELGETLSSHPQEVERIWSARYQAAPQQLRVFGHKDWFSPPASGSNPPNAMVICPCSMGTVAAIASGLSDNLIERAADVVLKEKRPLIVVPRETPFSIIHLENLLRLAQAGATILPPSPGFYHHPENINDLVDYVVARMLDHLNIPHTLMPRWGNRTTISS